MIKGEFTLSQVVDGKQTDLVIVRNTVLYDWGFIVSKLLAGDFDDKYHIRYAYIEFENNNGLAVTPPTVDRSQGKSYYDGLAGSNRDYLRVPIIGSTIDSTDTNTFPNGNRLTVSAQTSGTTGVHGLPFDDVNMSRVYGLAAVCAPDPNNPSLDIVFSRAYLSTNEQLIKKANSQIVVSWKVSFL